MKIMYLANILIVGWIGISALLNPRASSSFVFSHAYPQSDLIKLLGSLWLTIAFLSLLGLWKPLSFAAVFIFQLIYKALWLFTVALPAIMKGDDYPRGLAASFLIWMIILPFVIPWRSLF